MKHSFYTDRQYYLRPNFPHIEKGLIGIGGKPFVSFDSHFSEDKFEILHNEILMGLSRADSFDHGLILGEIPPEFADQYKTIILEAELFGNIEKYDPTGVHRKNLDSFTTNNEKRRYCYFAMGAFSPWYGVYYLIRNDFRKKTESTGTQIDWEKGIEHFPQLKAFILGLQESIFESLGRVLFFISYPNVETIIHRDYLREDHKDHCINFFFGEGRPAYIYDEKNKLKHYLPKTCKSYFFNNRDYHGVDAEPKFRYTLRVDGTFKSQIAESIGLSDGWLRVN